MRKYRHLKHYGQPVNLLGLRWYDFFHFIIQSNLLEDTSHYRSLPIRIRASSNNNMHTKDIYYSAHKFRDVLIYYYYIHTGDNGARMLLMSWGMKGTKIMRMKGLMDE
jgi:hypothetical protein